MVKKLVIIHGSSSKITIEFKDARVNADGKLLAKDGGFVVSLVSFQEENGKL